MLEELTPKQVQVQESIEIIKARKTQEAVIAWGHDASNCEIHQGIYLESLQATYSLLEPDSTWKEYVVGNCNMSYRTARRRIRAAEWHTLFGAEIETLLNVDASRLEQYRDLATDETYREILMDLLPPECGGAGLSDADMIAKWKGDTVALQEPAHPIAKIVRVHCPTCDTDIEAEVVN